MTHYIPILDEIKAREHSPQPPVTKPLIPAKSRRGGRRPGAGAPMGNMNGLKTGRFSRRFYLAALMVAVIPELRLVFHAFSEQWNRQERQRYMETLMEAYKATLADPELANTIKQLVRQRVTKAFSQIRAAETAAQTSKTQSSNQTPPDLS